MKKLLILFLTLIMSAICVIAEVSQHVPSNMNRHIGDPQSYTQYIGSKSSCSKSIGYSPQNQYSYDKTVGGYGSTSRYIFGYGNVSQEAYNKQFNNNTINNNSTFWGIGNIYDKIEMLFE